MSSLALSNLAAQTQRAAHAQTRGVNRFRRRWMHHALRRQGIMMPALSPFMTEGTVTRWKKREGESFQAGEVLLQIENEVGMVDVEASAPGILGKILTPDGTSHVPVESMIAIVARDATELATIQSQSLAPTPPPFSPTPIPPSSPRYPDAHYKIPMMSPRTPIMSPRTPSLFEMHTMGMGHRSAHVGGPRGARPAGLNLNLEEAPRSPRTPIHSSQEGDVNGDIDTPVTPAAATPFTAADICYTKTANANGVPQESQLDGAAIRRMIVANLSASRAMEVEEFV